MKNIALVLGSFHKDYITQMRDMARQTAETEGLKITEEIWVPGSMEKPLVIKKLLSKKKIDGVVVLGIIEKGETAHGVTMGNAVISAIINLQLEFMKPVGVGILGPGISLEQIPPRVLPYAKDAVLAVSDMLRKK